jgi:hypothetical protein
VETYKTCEDYKEDDIKQNICESIIPRADGYENDFYYIKYTEKCVYENNKCIQKKKNCNEYIFLKELEFEQNRDNCENLKPNDNNKICFLYNDKCIESYSQCEDYNQNVQKEACESIIPQNYNSSKCIFDENNNKCITEMKTCSSFKPLKVECESLGFYNIKECIYSDGYCLENTENTVDKASSSNTKNANADNSYSSNYYGGKNYILKQFIFYYLLFL